MLGIDEARSLSGETIERDGPPREAREASERRREEVPETPGPETAPESGGMEAELSAAQIPADRLELVLDKWKRGKIV